jgi:tartrate-resistant acid phosphatase type 5
VQAYICGHDHNLQHNHPENTYTDYFISGAGSEIKDNPHFNKAKFAESIAGFADVTIKSDALSLNFIDKTGDIIYPLQKVNN